jgi:hypothetical protein
MSGKSRQSEIPDSLTEPRSPGSVVAQALDSLTLLSASVSGDQVILRVSYQIGRPHSRPVRAAARLVHGGGLGGFAYGTESLPMGSGETTITIQLGSQGRPPAVRLMLFETGGAMFFSQDFPFPQ